MNNRKSAAGGAKALGIGGGKSNEARNADGYSYQYAFSQGCSYVCQCLVRIFYHTTEKSAGSRLSPGRRKWIHNFYGELIRTLSAELLGQIKEVTCSYVVSSDGRNFSGFTLSALERAVNKGGSQAVLLRGLEVVVVGGDHHDLFRLEVEELRSEKVNFGVRFVAANVFRGQNAIPRQSGVLRHIREQRDVAV
jgi:hypothetical protein